MSFYFFVYFFSDRKKQVKPGDVDLGVEDLSFAEYHTLTYIRPEDVLTLASDNSIYDSCIDAISVSINHAEIIRSKDEPRICCFGIQLHVSVIRFSE